jgi:hypothetical protein
MKNHEIMAKLQFHHVFYRICSGALQAAVNSVVDPKLFVTDPDPTFQRVTDPDPTLKKVPDPVSDPTLNIYFFSRTIILRSFNSILKHNFRRIFTI